jgi:hypothetical protein
MIRITQSDHSVRDQIYFKQYIKTFKITFQTCTPLFSHLHFRKYLVLCKQLLVLPFAILLISVTQIRPFQVFKLFINFLYILQNITNHLWPEARQTSRLLSEVWSNELCYVIIPKYSLQNNLKLNIIVQESKESQDLSLKAFDVCSGLEMSHRDMNLLWTIFRFVRDFAFSSLFPWQ